MMNIPMAEPARQYQFLKEEIDTAVLRLLAKGTYIGGDSVLHLEKSLASRLDLEDWGVVSCANGTDALELAYEAVGLTAGDEIIVPVHNYVAAAEAALRLGLVPVWADCGGTNAGEQCYNISIQHLKPLITSRTRALVAVNLYGMPIDASALKTFCEQYGLILIEDNAQGLGGYAHIEGGVVPMGKLGAISTTSFFPTKPLGCAGDGGAIFTNNEEWAKRARTLARHGQGAKYDYKMIGRNSRLDAIQAEILSIKLRHLDDFVRHTQCIATQYTEGLSDIEGLHLPTPGLHLPTYHQYTLMLDKRWKREHIRQRLIDKGISSGLYYPQPLHQYPVYAKQGVLRQSLPHSEEISCQMLSLPIFALQTQEEVEYVLTTLRSLLR